ncbi:MAG: tripartite tricarboxylate transporter substrate binding protein [Ramlibacter sp.]
MRRDEFCKYLAALAATAAGEAAARKAVTHEAVTLKMWIPANPGGGWDTTGRVLGKAIVEATAADAVQYTNKGGAGGVIGLAQFTSSARRDPHALMVMGAVMLGGIIMGEPPVRLQACTPIARLTSEYNVFAVPASSRFRTMGEVVAQLKKDPGSIKWGGGSRGSTEHIAACLLARRVGVDPKKINYVAFRGGGEASAAVLAEDVTVGGSGYGEFADSIQAGKMRALGVTSAARLPNVSVPTLKEQGWNVVIRNWRGIYGAPGISPEERDQLAEIVTRGTRTRAWRQALEANFWTPELLTGRDFDAFVEQEFKDLRALMRESGMI